MQQIKLYTKYKPIRWSHRLRVRTGGFQSPNRGSNPRGTAKILVNIKEDQSLKHYVYILKNIKFGNITYVGWTNNLKKRLKKHNSGKGAKFTRGRIWKIIYFKYFKSKSKAMKEEYKFKKNRNLRNKIINEKKNCNSLTL